MGAAWRDGVGGRCLLLRAPLRRLAVAGDSGVAAIPAATTILHDVHVLPYPSHFGAALSFSPISPTPALLTAFPYILVSDAIKLFIQQ